MHRRFAPVVVMSMLVWSMPVIGSAQATSGTRLGLGAAGHIGANAALAIVEHAQPAFELGASMDLGSIGSRRTRLLVDLGFFNTVVDRPDSAGKSVRGPFYDLAASVGITQLFPRVGRVEPYLAGGVALHAIGSAIGDPDLDVLYNANRFGAYIGAGSFITVSPEGRNGVQIEVRGVFVHAVNRVAFRLGYVRFFGDRKRPP
jgi:hypothetical protein